MVKVRILSVLAATCGLMSIPSVGLAIDEDIYHLGLVEYEVACLPCHGVEGRGDGPEAEYLESSPADLTQISVANGGTFPSQKIALMIDGRDMVTAHGPRTMPVWGERYRARSTDFDDADALESEARQRIDALVQYLEAIQEE